MGTSRRARRVKGRVAGTQAPGSTKGGVAKPASSRAVRKAGKVALLAAARQARQANAEAPPRLIALIPLSTGADAAISDVARRLRDCGAAAVVEVSRTGGSVRDWMVAVLDAGKVADVVMFVFGDGDGTGEGDVDEVALDVIAALRAQGLPVSLSVAVGNGASDSTLRRLRGRKLAAESLGLDSDLRPFDMSGEVGPERVLRKCCGGKGKEILWRRRYGYMLVEDASVVEPLTGQINHPVDRCTLELTGCVRGAGVSANSLLMITGVGSFKIGSITTLSRKGGVEVLGTRNEEEAEPAESEAPVDDLAGEQTWPPEDDADMGTSTEPVKKVRVPKGFSEYQSAWLQERHEGNTIAVQGMDGEVHLEQTAESDLEGDYEEADEGEAGNVEEGGSGSEMSEEEVEDDDMEVDAEEVARVRAAAAAQTDREFPDEVDTPVGVQARTRFARYRGLKSFRTSSWDPKEQLPRPYSRLFQFADLGATRKRVLAEAEKTASGSGRVDARAGRIVKLSLIDVPVEVAHRIGEVVACRRMPVVASTMLRHENRRSVVHFGLQRVDGDGNDGGGVVKAKDPMEIHCGFARFVGRPMYSEQNANSDKHKMERYLVHGRYTVASFYGPAIYAPAPALLFRPGGGLVATGSALGADPDRITLKRIVLTGYPFKTQKKRVVVKFMFFSPEDIRWFRPVELWTKLGRSGHIVAPLGTHGRMKCIFDAPVLHHDTVCMTLYKRVYPKSLEPEN